MSHLANLHRDSRLDLRLLAHRCFAPCSECSSNIISFPGESATSPDFRPVNVEYSNRQVYTRDTVVTYIGAGRKASAMNPINVPAQ